MTEQLTKRQALQVKRHNAQVIRGRLNYWLERGQAPKTPSEWVSYNGAVEIARTLTAETTTDERELVVQLDLLIHNIDAMLEVTP